MRRLLLDRRLILDKDDFILPTGLLQLRTTTIAYANIRRVWRVYLPWTMVLRIATNDRGFQIVSMLLPDNESYLAVEAFLLSKAR